MRLRGGWAWFKRLVRCIAAADEACRRGMPQDQRAEIAAALYRELS